MLLQIRIFQSPVVWGIDWLTRTEELRDSVPAYCKYNIATFFKFTLKFTNKFVHRCAKVFHDSNPWHCSSNRDVEPPEQPALGCVSYWDTGGNNEVISGIFKEVAVADDGGGRMHRSVVSFFLLVHLSYLHSNLGAHNNEWRCGSEPSNTPRRSAQFSLVPVIITWLRHIYQQLNKVATWHLFIQQSMTPLSVCLCPLTDNLLND